MSRWLLLTYKVPREPSASRVYVWRKVKALGAVAVQDAVWALPATPRTQEQLQWLAAEVSELGGEASLWTSDLVYATDEQALVRQFAEQVEELYRGIRADLRRKGRDLAALSKQFQQAQARDYFHSELGRAVREELLQAQGDGAP